MTSRLDPIEALANEWFRPVAWSPEPGAPRYTSFSPVLIL